MISNNTIAWCVVGIITLVLFLYVVYKTAKDIKRDMEFVNDTN